MLPATPSKKTLTNDIRSAIDASNTHRDALVPEDLSMALRGLGSRVRKNVTEGYNTQRLTNFAVPVTPHPSPAKLPTTQNTPTPIFTTANDALNAVFSTSPRIPFTPSPRKRRRAEAEHNDVETDRDRDVEMDGGDAASDDEDEPVLVELGPDASSNLFSLPRREIKPLRRSVARRRTSAALSDSCAFMTPTTDTDSPSLDDVQHGARMDLSAI